MARYLISPVILLMPERCQSLSSNSTRSPSLFFLPRQVSALISYLLVTFHSRSVEPYTSTRPDISSDVNINRPALRPEVSCFMSMSPGLCSNQDHSTG